MMTFDILADITKPTDVPPSPQKDIVAAIIRLDRLIDSLQETGVPVEVKFCFILSFSFLRKITFIQYLLFLEQRVFY